jgi:mannose-6-phosphate isomerase-like protein (cupin superfamily)/YHS domain-containing protein
MTLESINSHCPFSGKPVQSDSITTYQGVNIGFCNPCCRNDFAANPTDFPQVLGEFFPKARINLYDATTFVSEKDWGSLHLANIDRASIKIHSTSQPYHWHVNDGQEIFVVLDGEVDMYYRTSNGKVSSTLLKVGNIAHFEEGAEHVAHPRGLARILVIERLGSA